MTTREKLLVIMRLSGLTQAKLANRLGVTFAALNRWINEIAVPRPAALARVDELYREYSGEKRIPASISAAKQNII
jgi:transcriptional regulator with XRE-family HTH domain